MLSENLLIKFFESLLDSAGLMDDINTIGALLDHRLHFPQVSFDDG